MINPAIIRRNKRAIVNTRRDNTLARYMDRLAWMYMRNYQRWLMTDCVIIPTIEILPVTI